MMGVTTTLEKDQNRKKSRSAIVVSTAHDLHQIVTHSKNLWTKYNAIAKEHNHAYIVIRNRVVGNVVERVFRITPKL